VSLAVAVGAIAFVLSLRGGASFGPRLADVPQPEPVPPGLRALLWLSVPVAAVLLGVGLRGEMRWRERAAFPRAEGVVRQASVEPATVKRHAPGRRRSFAHVRGFEVRAAYDFRWEGKDRVGERILPDDDGFRYTRAGAERLLGGLKPGHRVTVVVDPAAPERSFLRAPPRWRHWFWIVVGAALAVASVWLA
jgi:hypothetical protein